MRTKIYFLRGKNRFVVYVGKTCKPLKKRLQEHIQEAMRGVKNHRCNGIRAMLRRGVSPIIDLITEVEGDGCKAEIAYIKWLRSKGIDLWNGTDGGDGIIGYVFSLETRLKMSLASKGKKKSLEHRRRISSGLKGKKKSETHKQKMRLANIGKPRSEEAKRKTSLTLKGRIFSEDTKRKISLACKGKPKSEEAKRKMSLAKKGKIPWNKGKPPSEGTRKKISLTLKRYFNLKKEV